MGPEKERAALALGLAHALDELLCDELGDTDGEAEGGSEARPEPESDSVGLALSEPPSPDAALAETPGLPLAAIDCVEAIVGDDAIVSVLLGAPL